MTGNIRDIERINFKLKTMEPQFRIWDKKRGEMINLRPAELSDVQGAHIALAFEEYGHTRTDESERIEGYEIIQFIGLKDKNGKKIYEGDIIENEFGKKIVKWADGGFYCEEEKNVMRIYMWLLTLDKIEVIGNIYENPELLK